MSTEVLGETNDWAIEYDDEIGAVVHRWKNHTTGDRFREGCENTLAIIQNRGAEKLLIDSRAITALKQKDIGWMFSDWVPRSIDAGVETTATVYPESTIAKMNIDGMKEEMEDLDEVGEALMTTEIAEARSWLAKR